MFLPWYLETRAKEGGAKISGLWPFKLVFEGTKQGSYCELIKPGPFEGFCDIRSCIEVFNLNKSPNLFISHKNVNQKKLLRIWLWSFISCCHGVSFCKYWSFFFDLETLILEVSLLKLKEKEFLVSAVFESVRHTSAVVWLLSFCAWKDPSLCFFWGWGVYYCFSLTNNTTCRTTAYCPGGCGCKPLKVRVNCPKAPHPQSQIWPAPCDCMAPSQPPFCASFALLCAWLCEAKLAVQGQHKGSVCAGHGTVLRGTLIHMQTCAHTCQKQRVIVDSQLSCVLIHHSHTLCHILGFYFF